MRRTDRGSASIELAIIAPAVLAVFVTVFIAGRTVIARQSVDSVAFDAARTASLARNGDLAYDQAKAAAMSSLAAQNINCVGLDVKVDVSGFTVPVGQPANVTVTIDCVVGFGDIAFPGMPGSARLTSTYTSPLDQFRTRS